MGKVANKAQTARANARVQRLEKAAAKRDGTSWPPPAAVPPAPQRRRPVTLTCAWCGTKIPVKPAGRIPTWCSATCRHRAWEQNRAAASGYCAIEIVERIVEVERPTPKAKKKPATTLPNGTGWDKAIGELVRQLDTGRIYQRDIPAIARASITLNDALHRRLTTKRR